MTSERRTTEDRRSAKAPDRWADRAEERGSVPLPKRSHYVAAVIHEEDRDMDRHAIQPDAKEKDLQRWEHDAQRDLQENPSEARASRVNEDAGRPGASKATATGETGHPRPAVAATVELDMAVAMRDISQFVARQLQAQRGVVSAGVASTTDRDGVAAEQPPVASVAAHMTAADPEPRLELEQIEKQIRDLCAAMEDDDTASAAEEVLSVTWREADEVERSQQAEVVSLVSAASVATVADLVEVVQAVEQEEVPTAAGHQEEAVAQSSEEVLHEAEAPIGCDDVIAVPVQAEAEAQIDAAPEPAPEPEPMLAAEPVAVSADKGGERVLVELAAAPTAEDIEAEGYAEELSPAVSPLASEVTRELLSPELPEAAVFFADRATIEVAADARHKAADSYDDTALVARVNALEQQIVALISRVQDSEQRLEEVVLASQQRPDPHALEEVVMASRSFSGLRDDVGRLTAQRDDTEAHFSDSLDALHDAIKELTERIGRLEMTGRGDDAARANAGIASSVLTSRLMADDRSPRAITREPNSSGASEGAGDDHLPVWLDEGAAAEVTVARPVETPADVFASGPGQTAASFAEVRERELAPQNRQQPDDHAGSSAERRKPAAAASVAEQFVPRDEPRRQSPVVELASLHEEGHDEDEPIYPPVSPRTVVHDDSYLKSVRASVAARSTLIAENGAAESRSHPRGPLTGSLVDAARHGDTDLLRAKGRLGEKPAGRSNMLFVATTVVLFVTSAMLLYGMNRQEGERSSVAKVNAVEPKPTRIPLVPRPQNEPSAEAGQQATPPAEAEKSEKRSSVDAEGGKTAVGSISLPMKLADIAAGTGLTAVPEPKAKAVEQDILVTSALPQSGSTTGKPADVPVLKASAATREAKPVLPAEIAPLTVRMDALNGDARAQHEIARNYEKGVGVSADAGKALSWYQRSAQVGYAPSAYRLALLHERGEGVAKSIDKAVTFYLAAAEKGNVNAMHNLGVLYSHGELGKTDYAEAVRWYGKAAEFGVKDSQVNLAIIYQNGLGVSRDKAKAFRWYSIAATAGDEEARQLATGMRGELPADMSAAIEKEARAFRAAAPSVEANYQTAQVRTVGNVRVVGPAGE